MFVAASLAAWHESVPRWGATWQPFEGGLYGLDTARTSGSWLPAGPSEPTMGAVTAWHTVTGRVVRFERTHRSGQGARQRMRLTSRSRLRRCLGVG